MGSRSAWTWKSLAGCLVAAASFLTVVPGCGGGSGPAAATAETDDQKAVKGVVGSVADYSNALNRLKTLYVKAAAPKSSDMSKYKDASFSVSGEVVVTGETATAPVDVIRTNPTDGSVAAPVTHNWKFQKEDGQWKIVESPL